MRRFFFCFLSFFSGFLFICPLHFTKPKLKDPKTEKPFVILIPSYNNEEYCQENIQSALQQDYQNFRVIFVDDCSTDRTLEIVKNASKSYSNIQIIHNKERRLALENIYHTIHDLVHDEEIVITLDGDDALANPDALKHLNKIYSNPLKETWLTYGQFLEQRSCKKGFASDIPKEIVNQNAFRNYPNLPTHLRSFYAWLFKRVDLNDLQEDGKFFQMSWDSAIMLPMIEMARDHFVFIPKILYLYNDDNPISDHQIDQQLQFMINQKIRNKNPYQPL